MDGPKESYLVKKVRGEISHNIPCIWNLKRNYTNELTYKIEKDS